MLVTEPDFLEAAHYCGYPYIHRTHRYVGNQQRSLVIIARNNNNTAVQWVEDVTVPVNAYGFKSGHTDATSLFIAVLKTGEVVTIA